ncbi:MAG TPA: hypothetical protein VM681_04515 [Candidatus Thermoplasmatota archaeon]|nr:hypothetical protein [Candidatus Thermoplasmatota archaeon]
MRALSPRARILIPGFLYGAALLSVPLAVGARWLEFLGWLSVYLVPPFGRETVIPALVARNFEPWLVVAYLLTLDVAACLLVFWNWERLKRVPRVGPVLVRFESAAQRFLSRRPWLSKTAFVSLIAYAIVPHQGGGGAGTAALGRSLGYDARRIFPPLLLGSAAVTVALAYGSVAILALLGDLFWVVLAATACLTLVGVLAMRQAEATAPEAPPAPLAAAFRRRIPVVGLAARTPPPLPTLSVAPPTPVVLASPAPGLAAPLAATPEEFPTEAAPPNA